MGKWWRGFSRRGQERREEREYLARETAVAVEEVKLVGEEVRMKREAVQRLIDDFTQRQRGRND
jgi:hypothetical protein